MKKVLIVFSLIIFIKLNLNAQIPSYVPSNGLKAWYPFSGNANDLSGNANNGTVNGATLTTDRFGNINKAYSFDGVNDYIVLNPTLTSPFSVSFWVNVRTFKTYVVNNNDSIGSHLFGNFNNDFENTGFSIALDGKQSNYGKHGCSFWSQINPFIQSNNLFLVNNWKHILCTYNGNTLKYFNNGILIDTLNSTYVSNNSPLTIGARLKHKNGPDFFFDGLMDDIGIWNRALNQDEITALYSGCVNNLSITPVNNNKTIGTNAIFTATVSDPNPSYIWQSDFGQGYVNLNNVGKYSGTSTNTMSISNVQLSNHMEPIRAISVSGNCRDTSNIAYIKITDTCIAKITKYDTIKVTDTLVINATLSAVSAPNNTNRLIIYPNPAKDHITIDYGLFSRMNGYTLKIVNTLGQTVFSSTINQQSSYINLSTWTGKGMYHVQIFDTQNNMIENRKIILQ